MTLRTLFILALFACNDGTWQPGPTCGRAGSACSEHDDCCSFSCDHGTCACAPAGEHCLADSACCVGMCVDEQCVGGCRETYLTCTLDSDCCSNNCAQGVCAAGSACKLEGEGCSFEGDCCDGLGCYHLTCMLGCAGNTCHSEADCCGSAPECYAGTCIP